MLHLHNASAGSGKTYTLTRTYIKLILGERLKTSNPDRSERYRLRNDKEIVDAHSHILAVTFTNKATNEMKTRIVKALAALAYCTPEEAEDVEYMEYFMKTFDATARAISNAALTALQEVLEHYTDFQVSTIDSFFQTILRSFAFETDLQEDYDIELDDEYVNTQSLGDVFLSLRDNNVAGKELRHWLGMLMVDSVSTGKKWNIPGRDSSYRDMVKYIGLISKERFKEAREKLDNYFKHHPDFITEGERIMELTAQWTQEKFKDVRKCVNEFRSRFGTTVGVSANFFSTLARAEAAGDGSTETLIVSKSHKLYRQAAGYKNDVASDRDRSLFLKKAPAEPIASEMLDIARRFYEAVDEWQNSFKEVAVIKSFIPRLGILKWVLTYIADFRKENNLVQLSDTNAMLRRIIKEDDVPFIYEKTGTFIHHYLIDEFQDTSAMQWLNLRPLLLQSLAEGHENLIIGDAKQSIYRFRNADFSLISTHVPSDSEIKRNILMHGTSKEENRNYRSSRDIVLFNNEFILAFAPLLLSNSASVARTPITDMQKLYKAAPQEIKHTDRRGYVQFISKTSDNCFLKELPSDNTRTTMVPEIAKQVSDLIKRGYRQDEIAVLVRTNDQGVLAIEDFINFNNNCAEDETRINFVSADSLKINHARSVKIIMSILSRSSARRAEALAESTQPDFSAEKDGELHTDKKYSHNSDVFGQDVNRLLGEYPELDTPSAIELCISGKAIPADTEQLLDSIDNSILPAMVEQIIGSRFIGESLRKDEAAYLAAFQDRVTDYCSRYPADISSFVKWWADNGDRFSIASPDAAEAVNVLTVHRAKGLEYRCVIMPWVDFRISPYREQMWIEPSEEVRLNPHGTSFLHKYHAQLPPCVPIEATSRLENTPLEHHFVRVKREVALETLNDIYVAFTRAVDELYVYVEPEADESHADSMIIEASAGLLSPEGIYGVLPDANAIAKGRKSNNESILTRPMSQYFVNQNRPNVVCRDADATQELYTDDAATDDKRAEGIMMHRIMSSITSTATAAADIEKGVLREVVRGAMDESAELMVKARVAQLVDDAASHGWFMPESRYVAERGLLGIGNLERPDRIEFPSKGHARVLDYKFGQIKRVKYVRQVRSYIEALMMMDGITNVEGWIWYVDLNEWVKV